MSETAPPEPADGRVRTPERQGDVLAIQELVVAYGHAVDDRDWTRWEALFTPDAHIDYLHSGGIAGTPAELAAWMPDALSMFTWSLHSVHTHEIAFTGPEIATGRLHLFNRNGLEWNGRPELFDVGGRYLDEYRVVDGHWRFARRRVVTDGYSPAYGARFLKRVIDDQIKLPLSQRWKDSTHFRASLKDGQVVVETAGPRLVAASDSDQIAVNY